MDDEELFDPRTRCCRGRGWSRTGRWVLEQRQRMPSLHATRHAIGALEPQARDAALMMVVAHLKRHAGMAEPEYIAWTRRDLPSPGA